MHSPAKHHWVWMDELAELVGHDFAKEAKVDPIPGSVELKAEPTVTVTFDVTPDQAMMLTTLHSILTGNGAQKPSPTMEEAGREIVRRVKNQLPPEVDAHIKTHFGQEFTAHVYQMNGEYHATNIKEIPASTCTTKDFEKKVSYQNVEKLQEACRREVADTFEELLLDAMKPTMFTYNAAPRTVVSLEVPMNRLDLRDKIARTCHIHWMAWMWDQLCKERNEHPKSCGIGPERVRRWDELSRTSWEFLTEREKRFSCGQANAILALVNQHVLNDKRDVIAKFLYRKARQSGWGFESVLRYGGPSDTYKEWLKKFIDTPFDMLDEATLTSFRRQADDLIRELNQ